MPDPKSKEKGVLDKALGDIIEKAVTQLSGPVINYVEGFFTKICTYLEDYDANVTKLQQGRHGLVCIRDSLNKSVYNEAASSHGTGPSAKVKEWNGNVTLMIGDADKLIMENRKAEGRPCLGDCCVTRIRYGKKVFKCVEGLTELKKEGEKIIQEKKFVEDGREHNELTIFDNKLHTLGDDIINIKCLKDELKRIGGWKINGWVQRVEKELRDSEPFHSEQEEGMISGSTISSLAQSKVVNCIKRIGLLHVEGDGYSNTTAGAGPGPGPSPSSSPNEISECPPPDLS